VRLQQIRKLGGVHSSKACKRTAFCPFDRCAQYIERGDIDCPHAFSSVWVAQEISHGLTPPPKERQAPDPSVALSHHPGSHACYLDDLTTYASTTASILLPPLSILSHPIRRTLSSASSNQRPFQRPDRPYSEHRIGCGGGDIANVVGSLLHRRSSKTISTLTQLSPWPNHADPLPTIVRTL